MGSTKTFLLGAGAAFLLDPKHGRRRRHLLRDRLEKIARRSSRVGLKKARYAGGHVRGLHALARRVVSARELEVDDDTVTQRIRSDALRAAGVSTNEVEVEVEDGLAILRGSVSSSSRADELVSQVQKVPGVRDVAAMIRVSSRAA